MIYVFADPSSQTARPVPTSLRDIMLGYEAGQQMVQIELGAWQTLKGDAIWLRTEVFVNEQGIGPGLQWDASDATALHVVVRNRMGLPVATGRLLQLGHGVARIGFVAVHRMVRGSNLGRELLKCLLQAAIERGNREVLVHGQQSSEGFFRRLGFLLRGTSFEESGTMHIEMHHPLESHHPQ